VHSRADGVSVALDRTVAVASLRYLEPAGEFASAAERALRARLPAALQAVISPAVAGRGELILAWRSPTETLLLSDDAAALTEMAAPLANFADGCWVDQSGGLWAVRIRGARSGDLLLRLGSSASNPALGEARTGRIAELPVLALCVRPGEILLLVERVYAEHLLGWIGATVGDFTEMSGVASDVWR
jgi:sarcosine oxidase gamma subunit